MMGGDACVAPGCGMCQNRDAGGASAPTALPNLSRPYIMEGFIDGRSAYAACVLIFLLVTRHEYRYNTSTLVS